MDPSFEIVEGQGLVEMLRSLIDSRKICRMEIPRTAYGWITLLLGLQAGPPSGYLLIDRVSGFEKALSSHPGRGVSLEFLEGDGVACRFNTRVVECGPQSIRVELPKSIFRMQKRRWFRVKARSGAMILFRREGEKEKENRARVRDYSLGGALFVVEPLRGFRVGEELAGIQLRIPDEDHWICFEVPRAVVRRLENHASNEVACAVEFLEVAGMTKEFLWRHLFREERMALQRTRRG